MVDGSDERVEQTTPPLHGQEISHGRADAGGASGEEVALRLVDFVVQPVTVCP